MFGLVVTHVPDPMKHDRQLGLPAGVNRTGSPGGRSSAVQTPAPQFGPDAGLSPSRSKPNGLIPPSALHTLSAPL